MSAVPATASAPAVSAELPPAAPAQPHPVVIDSIKGFSHDMTCRGHKFEFGATYTHAGRVSACNSGFHAIEGNPLEVFDYYPPGQSRYAEVKQSGELSRHSGDSKLASAIITIGVEIKLHDLAKRVFDWVVARCTPTDANHAEGYRSAASSTGDRSAASSTGDRSAASSTGYQSAASSTGDRSAAMSSGLEGSGLVAEGCALFLVYRDSSSYEILHAWSGIAGRNGIKADVWYQLGADGLPFEVTP